MTPLPGDIFARRLRQERENAGITQAELARKISERLGITIGNSAITRIEKQERAVKLDEAVILAEAIGMPLCALLTEEPDCELDYRIQQYLIELTGVEAAWEKNRNDVQRLTRIIQTLTTEREILQQHQRG